MAEPQRFVLRATFAKQGRLALLSHLEVAATVERTVRRAGLPFAITQGFSPHMKIAFGAALPVGVGSTCEIFDVHLTRYVKPATALAALQAASVPDMMVQEAHYIEPHAKAASVAYPVSTYRAQLSEPVGNLEVPEQIVRVRRKKEKVLVVADYLVDAPAADAEDPTCVTFSLEAHETGSLRPDVLLGECLALWEKANGKPAGSVQVESLTRIAQRA